MVCVRVGALAGKTPGIPRSLCARRPSRSILGSSTRTVLFRAAKAEYHVDGHAHRINVVGRIEDLEAPILHDDRKPLKRWFQSQSQYTQLEAEKLIYSDKESLSWTDRIRRWRVVAPAAMALYCLFLRGGVLDGRAGIYYAFQRTLAELMLSLNLIEFDLGLTAKKRNIDNDGRSERGVRGGEILPTGGSPQEN